MSTSEAPGRRGPVLCLGDAHVDLVCERPVEALSAVSSFVPHLGGTAAAVAVVAARSGAAVALAGAAGDDSWGEWLRGRLGGEGVDLSGFALLSDAQTPVDFVVADGPGEPLHTRYGSAVAPSVVDVAEAGAGALFLCSDGLRTADGREATMETRAAALEAGLPVVFAPQLRLDGWRSQADAAASANACVPGALLVRCNRFDAAVMTGEDDPERAATALVKAGARLVVITLGADGAMLRGELRGDADGAPAQVVSTLGAGAVLTGVLLARLALSDFYLPAVAAALRESVGTAARACERWGSVD